MRKPGQPNNTLVVVKIANPVVEGADLLYSYSIIDGKMPANGGATCCSSIGSGSAGASVAASTTAEPGARSPGVL